MLRATIGFLVICILMGAGFASAQQPAKEQAAVTAAENWLSLVDGGKYAESWSEAAAFFKSTVPREQWVQNMTAGRKPLGKVVSRKLRSKSYETKLPGGPAGEYVVILYDTSFENKRSAVETVTPMMEKDGRWRISGYYIN